MDPDYRRAKKRVKAKKGFYSHLTAFIIVNGMMSLLLLTQGEPFGFLPPTLMWGIGLAFHYVKVFGLPGTGGVGTKTWEEREIEREYRKMKGRELPPPTQTMDMDDRLELKEVKKTKEKKKLYREDDLV